jgi:hypothetical protein
LGIGETGVIDGVFHAPTEASLKISRLSPSRVSTHPSIILSPAIKQTDEPYRQPGKLIIQTDSYNAE